MLREGFGQTGALRPDAKEFYARWKQIHRQHLEAPGTFLTEEVLYHRDLRELYAEYAIGRSG